MFFFEDLTYGLELPHDVVLDFAKRMTTAEPPEPLTLQHSEFIIFKQILLLIDGPAARLSVYSVYSVDS